MKALSYKNFVWPQNPDTYQEILEREPNREGIALGREEVTA